MEIELLKRKAIEECTKIIKSRINNIEEVSTGIAILVFLINK